MVAISLYKGNLHKVSDHQRKWVMPTPKMSLKDFKIFLRRRSGALSSLVSVNTAITAAGDSDHPSPSNPNSTTGENNYSYVVESDIPGLKEEVVVEEQESPTAKVHEDEDEAGGGDERRSEGGDCLGKLETEVADSLAIEVKHEVDDHNMRMENELYDAVGNQQVKMVDNEEAAKQCFVQTMGLRQATKRMQKLIKAKGKQRLRRNCIF